MRPFGFETNRATIRQDEAARIKEAAQRLIDGETLSDVERDWNAQGLTTTTGRSWQQGVLRRVMRNPRIAGKRKGPDGALQVADWEPIVDEVTFKRLQDRLDELAGGPRTAGKSRQYLLTGGIARCGICDSPLGSSPINGRRNYRCVKTAKNPAACGKIRIHGELLDDDVAERVIARLVRPDARATLHQLIGEIERQAANADQQIDDARSQLATLGEEYAKGNVETTTLSSARTTIDQRISSARRIQRTARDLQGIAITEARDLIEWWEGASLEQQRTLLSILVEAVVVKPAPTRGSKKYAPERVQIRWK